MAVMVMHEKISVTTPAKKLSYAVRFFFGRMPQLNDVAILGSFVRFRIIRQIIFETHVYSIEIDKNEIIS